MKFSSILVQSAPAVFSCSNKIITNTAKVFLAASMLFVRAGQAIAKKTPEPTLLLVGASWANGNLPLNGNMEGVWGG